jgi:hypothetical protein
VFALRGSAGLGRSPACGGTTWICHPGWKSPVVELSERGILELTFLIEDGFHIQPAIVGNDNFIPTLLTVGQAGGISFGTPVFPVPDSIFGAFYGYWGTIKVLVPLEVNQGTVLGQYNVAFTFTYQACKDKSCFFPRILNFNVRLGIEKDSLTLYVGDGQPTDRQP